MYVSMVQTSIDAGQWRTYSGTHSAIWLPAKASALFMVSIETSHTLVQSQMGWSMAFVANILWTDHIGRVLGLTTSDTCAPMLDPLLGAFESWGVVVSPTCALAVSVLLLSLSSDYLGSSFFLFLSPFLSQRLLTLLMLYIDDRYLAIETTFKTGKSEMCEKREVQK